MGRSVFQIRGQTDQIHRHPQSQGFQTSAFRGRQIVGNAPAAELLDDLSDLDQAFLEIGQARGGGRRRRWAHRRERMVEQMRALFRLHYPHRLYQQDRLARVQAMRAAGLQNLVLVARRQARQVPGDRRPQGSVRYARRRLR